MGAPARNPLIDRYYSPLATTLDLEAFRKDVDDARLRAIANIEDKLKRAEDAGRESEATELRKRLLELKLTP